MAIWTPGMTLESLERSAITEALRFYRNNKTQTASSLGIALRTLDNKLEKYESEDRKIREQHDARNEERKEFLQRQRGISSPDAGVRVESHAEVAAQSEVPVSERSQVQEVLSGQTAKGRVKKAG